MSDQSITTIARELADALVARGHSRSAETCCKRSRQYFEIVVIALTVWTPVHQAHPRRALPAIERLKFGNQTFFLKAPYHKIGMLGGKVMVFETARRAVIQVGGGRGFIVSAGETRYVITAAHCLPHYPEPHLANAASELSYDNILGGLGQHERTVWAELVEFNAASDVAVLGEPDGQVLWDESDQYRDFTEWAMTIGKSPAALRPHLWENHPGTAAFMLSLDCEWQPCTVYNGGRFLVIRDGADGIKSGMSGSPIIDINGAAIGLVSTGGASGNRNPSLMDCLPPWLLRELDTIDRAIDQEAGT